MTWEVELVISLGVMLFCVIVGTIWRKWLLTAVAAFAGLYIVGSYNLDEPAMALLILVSVVMVGYTVRRIFQGNE